MTVRKLYRSQSDRMIAGVFGGLSTYWSVDSTILRLIYTLLSVFTGVVPGIVGYIIAAIIIPRRAA